AFSPDDALVAAGAGDGAVRIYKVATGEKVADWPGHPGEVTALAFSPDGKLLSSASWDAPLEARGGTLRLREVASGRDVATFNGGNVASLNAVVFPPDGANVIAGARGGIVSITLGGGGSRGAPPESAPLTLWNASTGALVRRFEGSSAGIDALA